MTAFTRTCPQGHQWQSTHDRSSAGGAVNETCPVCGASAETLAPETLDPAALDPAALAELRPSAWPLLPGYVIESELGRGGMGVVFRARQTSLQRTVAVKMLVSGPLASPAALVRFRTEAEAVARLAHPNIVQIFEVGEAAGHAFFSLEFVEGGTLADRSRQGPFSPREAARLLATLAHAVQYAHDRGIVHRDLKPSNVLLMPDGTPKIADFGLAKQLASESRQTHTGDVLGSPSYMAPEQARGATQQVGPACDVYALGAILYELLTGRPPFFGEDAMETVLLVLDAEPLPPRRLAPAVARDLETICLKCLEKLPRSRYSSAAALADDLERFLSARPILARPVGPLERLLKWARRRPAVAALIVVVIGSTATLIGYGAWKNAQLNRALHAEQANRRRAESNFRKALDAADRRLTRAGQDPRTLLAEELGFYDDIRRQPGNEPEVRYEKGMAARRAGDVHRLLGDVPQAQRAYREAIVLLQELAEGSPEVAVYRRDLAAAHNGLGQLWQAVGKSKEAEEQLWLGLRLLEQLAVEDPDDFDIRRQLGVLWNNLAVGLSGQGRPQEAEAAHQKALALRRRLDADFPSNSAFRLDHSVTLANLAVVQSNAGRPDDAARALDESLRLRATLPESITAEAEFREATAKAYNNLAALRAKTGASMEAVDAYQQAIAALEGLARDYPAVPRYRATHADVQFNFGLHLAANGDFDKAQQALAAGLALWEKLAADDPQTPAYADNAKKLRSLLEELKQSDDSAPK